MNVILIAVISLGVIALVSAAILYVASKKFAVYEDPRIAQVAEVLPQANCGGCGYPGCSGFADACVKAGSLDGKLCPVGGQPVMTKIAEILGLDAAAAEPMVAVVRCNGTCANRPLFCTVPLSLSVLQINNFNYYVTRFIHFPDVCYFCPTRCFDCRFYVASKTRHDVVDFFGRICVHAVIVTVFRNFPFNHKNLPLLRACVCLFLLCGTAMPTVPI